MNKYELKMYFMVFIHTIVWLVALFGWVFGFEKFNIFILLPCIYLFQMLPMHKILEEKIRFVLKNKEHLKSYDTVQEIPRQECETDYGNKVMNISKDDIKDAFRYINYYEDSLFFPNYYTRNLKNLFYETSFQNPLSAQGFIILGFILNVFSLKFKKLI